MQCTPGLPNACPSGYTCQTASVVVGGVTSTTGYCCGLPSKSLRSTHQRYCMVRPCPFQTYAAPVSHPITSTTSPSSVSLDKCQAPAPPRTHVGRVPPLSRATVAVLRVNVSPLVRVLMTLHKHLSVPFQQPTSAQPESNHTSLKASPLSAFNQQYGPAAHPAIHAICTPLPEVLTAAVRQ